jgi:hypothetical protein
METTMPTTTLSRRIRRLETTSDPSSHSSTTSCSPCGTYPAPVFLTLDDGTPIEGAKAKRCHECGRTPISIAFVEMASP